MRNGIAISSMLHVGVVLAAIYGLPALVDPVDMVEQPIIVELVTIAERTVSQERAKSEPEKAPPPAPKLKPVAAPKAEPEPEPMKTPPPPPPEPVKVTAPPPPPPEPPKAEPKRSPKAIENAKVIAPPPPEPKKIPEKPKEKPKPPKKVAAAEPAKIFRGLPRPRAKPKRRRPKFSTDRIAALLDKDQEKKPQPRQERSKRQATAKARKAFKDISIPPAPARVRSVPMTMSEIDAIRYQIQQCWSIPAGARDAENLVVRIKVFLNSDGSLSKPPEIVGGGSGGGASDPFFRTAAESARRAVLKCSPLKNLPPDKYARWREITLTFNPRDMLGG